MVQAIVVSGPPLALDQAGPAKTVPLPVETLQVFRAHAWLHKRCCQDNLTTRWNGILIRPAFFHRLPAADIVPIVGGGHRREEVFGRRR